jgi:hypothetical protein
MTPDDAERWVPRRASYQHLQLAATSEFAFGQSPRRYLRLRRLRLGTGQPTSRRLSRFAFAATRRRYPRTISSADAPAIILAPALKAASTFSLIMSWLSRRPRLPPCISLIKRSPITWLDSSANIIKE